MTQQIDTLALAYSCETCCAPAGGWCIHVGGAYTTHLHDARVRPLLQARGDGVREGLARVGAVAVPLVGRAT